MGLLSFPGEVTACDAEYSGEPAATFSPQVGCQWQQYCLGSEIMGKGSDLLSSLAAEKQTLITVFYYSTL